jgi:5-methylcytosine-specific restriction endonuclease McrA
MMARRAVLLVGIAAGFVAAAGQVVVLPTKCMSSTCMALPTRCAVGASPAPPAPPSTPDGGLGPTGCSAGYTPNTTDVDGACVACARGETSAGENANCTACAQFTWADTVGSAKCSSCSSDTIAKVFTGDIGKIGTTVKHDCVADYAIVLAGSYKMTGTTSAECAVGTHASREGMAACEPCAGAKWARFTGSTARIRVADGSACWADI